MEEVAKVKSESTGSVRAVVSVLIALVLPVAGGAVVFFAISPIEVMFGSTYSLLADVLAMLVTISGVVLPGALVLSRVTRDGFATFVAVFCFVLYAFIIGSMTHGALMYWINGEVMFD